VSRLFLFLPEMLWPFAPVENGTKLSPAAGASSMLAKSYRRARREGGRNNEGYGSSSPGANASRCAIRGGARSESIFHYFSWIFSLAFRSRTAADGGRRLPPGGLPFFLCDLCVLCGDILPFSPYPLKNLGRKSRAFAAEPPSEFLNLMPFGPAPYSLGQQY
jgi:hypothetical protein